MWCNMMQCAGCDKCYAKYMMGFDMKPSNLHVLKQHVINMMRIRAAVISCRGKTFLSPIGSLMFYFFPLPLSLYSNEECNGPPLSTFTLSLVTITL